MNYFRNKILLTVFMNMVVANAFAQDIEADNADGVTIYYDYNGDAELQVVRKDYLTSEYNYSSNVVIPEEVTYMDQTYKVTRIDDYAFSNCYDLTSVTIPETVTSIGKRAFGSCSSLTSVTIPNSVTIIDEKAFEGSGLTSVTIPQNVTFIGEGAFYCSNLTSLTIECNVPELWPIIPCYNLESIAIGDNITIIEDGVFRECKIVKSIKIPNSITTIGNYAFDDCWALESVTIPKSVTSIGEGAWGDCFSLTSISVEEGNTVYDSRNNCNAIIKTAENKMIAGCKNTVIPDNVTSIEQAFYGCTGLTSISIPNSVTVIGESAFSQTGLTSITIPTSVNKIGSYAFSYCKELTSVVIPNSVSSLGNSVFQYCKKLESVTIPNSIKSIGDYTFAFCERLRNITVEATEPIQIVGDNNFLKVDMMNCILYVPDGCVEKYRSADYWKDFANIRTINEPDEPQPEEPQQEITIDDIVYEIEGAYVSVTHAENANGEIKIEASVEINGKKYEVKVIAKEAFKGATGLTSVTIPNSVTSIGVSAFEGCSNLNNIDIGNGIMEIGNKAFAKIAKSNTRTRVSGDGLHLYCNADLVPATASNTFDGTDLSNATLHVPDNLVDTYKNASPWNDFGYIMGLSGTNIKAITIDTTDVHIFDMQGNRLKNVRKGLNIIRSNDGKTKKVILK